MGRWKHVSFVRSQIARRRYFICMEAVFILGNLDTHDRIMRLLASYSQCTVIGIDYTLSPEARFPQAIEEIVAACCYFHQQAEDYQINMSRIGFAGDSAGAMLALASALWLRDKQIDCGKIAGVLLWYGLYWITGFRDSSSVGRCLGWLNATGFADV